MNKKIVKSGILISAGTFFSRILGLVREIACANYFGAGSAFDSFIVAFTIPNLFRRILGEEMFERAFMPRFKRLKEEGKIKAAAEFFKKTLVFTLFASLAVCLLIYFFVPELVGFIAPGLKGDSFSYAVSFGYKIIPFIFLISFATLTGAFLLFNGFSFIYAIAPAFMNVGIISFLVVFYRKFGDVSVVYAYLVGALLFFLFQIPFALKIYRSILKQETNLGSEVKESSQEFRNSLKEGVKIFWLSLINKSVEVVDRIAASLVGSGAISSLWYSFRIIHLPFAFFSLAISRALAPEFSKLKGSKDSRSFASLIEKGFVVNLAILLPITVFFMLFSSETVALFYKRGNFGAESLALTSKAFFYYSLALLPMGTVAVLGRAYSSLEDNTVPLIASLIGAGVNIFLDFTLYKTVLGQGGIALATAVSMYVQTIVLFAFLHRYRVGLEKAILKKVFTVLGIVIPYALSLFVLKYFLKGLDGFSFYLVFLAGGGLLSVSYFAGVVWLLKDFLKK